MIRSVFSLAKVNSERESFVAPEKCLRVFAARASGGGGLLLLPQQSRTQVPFLPPPKSFRGDSSACFRSLANTVASGTVVERSIERRCQVLILELKGGPGGLECGGAAAGQTDGRADDGSSTSAESHDKHTSPLSP
jgi:hypothetical protein